MEISLTTTTPLRTFQFIGTVAYPDTDKLDAYKSIFQGAKNEAELKQNLEKINIGDSAISNFIKTLKRLNVISETGEIPQEPLVDEEGCYEVKYLYPTNDVPFRFLPISIKRRLQDVENYEQVPNSEDFVEAFQGAQQLTSSTPIGIIRAIHSPQIRSYGETAVEVTIEINNENFWTLFVKNQNLSFRIPENLQLPLPRLFHHSLDTSGETPRLQIPFNEVKEKYPNSIKTFSVSFKDKIDDWGGFDASNKNVILRPRKEDLPQWYDEIFIQDLSVNGYLSREDLSSLYKNILYQYPTFQQEEFSPSFQYEDFIQRLNFSRKSEEYWLLKAVEDLNPFAKTEIQDFSKESSSSQSYYIPATNNLDFRKDILSIWKELDEAHEVQIFDRYAGSHWSLIALEKLFEAKTTHAKVKIFSNSDDSPNSAQKTELSQKRLKDVFQISIRPKECFSPHDRYWILDGKSYTVGISPNSINVFKDRVELKQQLNISPIPLDNLPKEIQEWSQN